MPLSIKIQVPGIEAAAKDMKKIRFRLRNMQPAMNRGSKHMVKMIRRRFQSESAPFSFGAGTEKFWELNTQATIDDKQHEIVLKGKGANKGALKKSVRGITGRNLLKISFRDYGQYHMTGYRTHPFGNKSIPKVDVPARPFAFPSKRDLSTILGFIQDYVLRGAAFSKSS